MAIDKPFGTVKCAWCEEDNLVQIPTENVIHCFHCRRPLKVHRVHSTGGGIKWHNAWYSTRVTQNTMVLGP